MSTSTLPLSYCTNVHAGRSVDEVNEGLDQYTVRVRENLREPLAAGLWLARPVTRELLDGEIPVKRFAERLFERGLSCHTLNAFPYGDFHCERVKENVYLPDWSTSDRLEYTFDCAKILSRLLPEATEGSISTLPLGFKHFGHPGDFLDRCIDRLIESAQQLAALHEQTGQMIRLAIEPEPLCILETTAESIDFFERLRDVAAARNSLEPVTRHLGLCFDICHQAVEFEDVAHSIAQFDAAGVRINKVHISCAIELDAPATNTEARQALARYVEPRYLHQSIARTQTGQTLRQVDLTEELALRPPDDFLNAEKWRIHFHVPVDVQQLGPLTTTHSDLRTALAAIARLDYAPHLEVETYTWEVLPETSEVESGSDRLVNGLTRELLSTRALISDVG